MAKAVSEEVMQELVTKLEGVVNNYCYKLEYFTDEEVQDFFQADSQEITYYNNLINDTITSKNFLWSSKQIAEELAKSIIESNSYADNLVKNIASIKLKYVTSLPTSDISEHTIYILKASDGTSKDTLNLYNATDGWTTIGDFNISLDNYYDKTEIDTKMDLKANKTEVVANDKIVQTLDPATNSSDTILSTSGLQTEMDKKANDDEVIKKTSLVTSIDKTSNDNEIPSAGAIYNKSKNKIKQLSSGEDIIAYADTISNETATDTVRVMNATNGPYGVNDVNNDFYYTIYNIGDDNFKRIVAYDIRKNDMHMIIKKDGVWGKWQRVCTTSVADVVNSVTDVSTLGITEITDGLIIVNIKNGWCQVIIQGLVINSTFSNTINIPVASLPKPAYQYNWVAVFDYNSSNSSSGSSTNITFVKPTDDSRLMVDFVTAKTGNYFTSFSYPVAES